MPNWSDFEVTIEGELSVIKGLYDQYLANDKKFLDTLVPEPEELHKKIQSILLTAVDTSNPRVIPNYGVQDFQAEYTVVDRAIKEALRCTNPDEGYAMFREIETKHGITYDLFEQLMELWKQTGGTSYWYDWRVKFWGTKWELCVADDQYGEVEFLVLPNGRGVINAFGQTAWAPPNDAFVSLYNRLSKIDKTLEIDWTGYETGCEYQVIGRNRNYTESELTFEFCYEHDVYEYYEILIDEEGNVCWIQNPKKIIGTYDDDLGLLTITGDEVGDYDLHEGKMLINIYQLDDLTDAIHWKEQREKKEVAS